MVGDNEMKVVAKLYYFSSTSSIKDKFVDFEADINFGVVHREKFSSVGLYPAQFYSLKEQLCDKQLHQILLDLNRKLLTRTNQNNILNYLEEKCL